MHNGSCVCFIKQPALILTKTLPDEVYWRLQGLCGLFSCCVLHSCASPREWCLCQLSLGRLSSYSVLCKAPVQPQSSQCAGGASQCKNRMARCFPVFWKYATTTFNLAGKTTYCGLNVLSECCKSHGETLAFGTIVFGAKYKYRTGNKAFTKALCERSL